METSILPGGPSVLIEYEYDGAGNVTAVRDSFGGVTTYAYDGAGRLVSIRQSGSSVDEKRVDAVYSATSVLTEIRRFADLAGSSPVASTALTFDCESCLLGLTDITHRRAADGSVIEQIELERNPAGLLERMADAEGEHSYVHDGQWRMIAADHPAGGDQPDEAYTYDGTGNRTSSHLGGIHVYGYSSGAGGNDIRGNDRFEYETDDRGNVARKRNRTTGASTEYLYDHRSRLTEVIDFSPAGAELRRSTYAYDTSDRRIRAVENGQVSYFVYDGLNPILVLNGAGSIVLRRLYGRGLDSILAFEVEGKTRWLLSDHLGSVRDVLGDDGQRLARHVYDSFGNLLGGTDVTASGGLGFTGLEHSVVTGLIPMRARAYDPELGRFLQMDPQEPHQYEYAENSPMTYKDASGLSIRPLGRTGIRLAADGPELFMQRLKNGFYSEREVLKRLNPPTKYSGYGPKQFPRSARPSPPRGGPGEAGMYALIVTGIGLGIIGAAEQVGTALLFTYDSILVYQEVYERISGGR